MIRDLFTSLVVIGLVQAAVPSAPQTPANQTPVNQTPVNQTPVAQSPVTQPATNQPPGNQSAGATDENGTPLKPSVPDPAAIIFGTELGLVLVAVKPDKIVDYENAIVALQEVLAKAEDEPTRQLARSWRVFKALPVDPKSPLYVHLLQPAQPGVDYRPSLLLDKLLAGAPADLLAKYRDAFLAGPNKLELQEFANMTVAPVPKPTNASPEAPAANTSPAKPGNGTPPPGLR